MADEDLRWCDVCDDCSHYKAVGDEKYQCMLEGGRCKGYFAYKKLKAENAALKEKLEKAVELPCKIGDEVYEVHGKCDGKNCVYNGYYGQWRCDYGGKTNCNPFITVNKFRYCDIPMVGKTIFVTKEEAETRLAELKGEKE